MSNATRKEVQRGTVTFSRLVASDFQKSGRAVDGERH